MIKITIQTDADFTPKGKRRALIVPTSRGGRQIRWYVGGRYYSRLPVTADNIAITQKWVVA